MMSQAAFKVEQALGHDGSAVTTQDISNPAVDRSKYADPSGEKMKALVWVGKNMVEVRKWQPVLTFSHDICPIFTAPPPCAFQLLSWIIYAQNYILTSNRGGSKAPCRRAKRCHPQGHRLFSLRLRPAPPPRIRRRDAKG